MAGRRPKPTAVKELAGNPGKRHLNRVEPRPPASSARAPRGLDEEGHKFWLDYVRGMAAIGVMKLSDEPAARLMTEHYAIAIRAATQLHDEELILEGRDGPKKNGLTQIFRDHSAATRSWMIEFGMTPASRSRLGTPEDEQPSLADELFRLAAERAAESEELR